MSSILDEELKFAILSVIRGFRNGLFYGTKIRLPHSLVMSLLFRRNANIRKFLDPIARMTWEHSRNLALFVGFYKLLLAIGRLVRIKLGDKITVPVGHPTTQLDAFIAAAFVGHFIWGRYTSINSQIVMYLFSRVVIALFKVAAKKEIKPFSNFDFETVYPWLATVTWGFVLWLYEFHPDTLQKSLFGSMDFLYHQTNEWKDGPSDFLPSPATSAIFVYLTLRAREALVQK